MRFNQLKSNPNSIVKKRLRKSGKQWIVISSLFFAGVLFIGGSTTVHAETVDANATSTLTTNSTNTSNKPETTDQTNTTGDKSNSDSSSTVADNSNVTDNEKDGSTTDTSNATSQNNADVSQNQDSDNNNQQDSNTEDQQGENQQDSNDSTDSTEESTLNAPAASNDLEATQAPVAASPDVAESNIAEGTFGTSSWYISSDGVLHIGAGDFNNTNYSSPWSNYSSQITSISFDGVVNGNTNSSSLFDGLRKVTEINNTNNFNTSKIEHLDYMFRSMKKLQSIDLSTWDTSSVQYMDGLFSGDDSLSSINIADWNTSKVISMNSTFSALPVLTSLDISDWDTSNVKDMGQMFKSDMFSGWGGLKTIDLSKWNVSNVKNMSGMFSGLNKLTSIDLSNWDVSNVTNMSGMFLSNYSLKSALLDNWNLAKVTNLSEMFSYDSSIDKLDLSTWKLGSSNIDTDQIFSNTNFKQLKLSGNDVFANDPELPDIVATDTLTGKWVNIGSGSVEKPDATSKLTSKELTDLYAQTGGPDDTWVRESINKSVTAPVTINSNLGPQTVDDQTGNIGDNIEVEVPQINGYSSDKDTVNAVVNADGTITTDEVVTYTSDKTTDGSDSDDSGNTDNSGSTDNGSDTNNSGSNSSETNDSQMIDRNQTVATYADKPAVALYDINGKLIEGRHLDTNTDWQSDKVLINDGTMFYRVSTDEWVRADDVYVYVADNGSVKTYLDSDKSLIDAYGDKVSRSLSAGTDWLFDRYIEINNVKYYRVSTNEFVKASDVIPYIAVKDVVQANSNVTLYNETGAELNKQLPVNTAWKIDKIAMINGVKMYRVSTNEWVKASDVVLNENVYNI